MTRTLAFQMSGPVPSPMMKGMIGWSGTLSLPFRIEILAPPAGGVTLGLVGVAIGFAISSMTVGSKAGRDASTRAATIRPTHDPHLHPHARRRWVRHAGRIFPPRRLLDALARASRQLA